MIVDKKYEKRLEFPYLEFDSEKHLYTYKGFRIPSVTQIMKPLEVENYKNIPEEVLDMAATRGTVVHSAFEGYVLSGIDMMPEQYKGYSEAFQKFLEEHKMEPIATETRCRHNILNYAGTVDLVCMLDGKLTVVDYKTTSVINDMLTSVQLEAYAKMLLENGIDIQQKAILQVKKTGQYVLKKYQADSEAWDTFLSLINVRNHIEIYRR